MDLSPAHENDLHPVIFPSLSPCLSRCIFVCVCARVCSSSNCACDGTWAQPMEMTGWGYFLFPALFFFFHALVDLWLVRRSTYQGTSIDQRKKFKWGCFSFSCVSVDDPEREHHSVSLWDLITDMKWSYSVVKDKIVGWIHTGKVPIRNELQVCQFGSLLAMHCDLLQFLFFLFFFLQLSTCISKYVVRSNDKINHVKLIKNYWCTFQFQF